jgi:hypothetical protein
MHEMRGPTSVGKKVGRNMNLEVKLGEPVDTWLGVNMRSYERNNEQGILVLPTHVNGRPIKWCACGGAGVFTDQPLPVACPNCYTEMYP